MAENRLDLNCGLPHRPLFQNDRDDGAFTHIRTEAAVHRISAASCYQKAGDPSRATNLFRAAVSGPLRAVTRRQVEDMLNECLALLTQAAPAKKRLAELATE